MVFGLLIALAAGVAMCHSCHKRHQQRVNTLRREYEALRGAPLTKAQWKQVSREHKQALKAAKRAHKAEMRMQRHSCWRTTSEPSPPPSPAPAEAPGTDVKYTRRDAPRAYKPLPPLPALQPPPPPPPPMGVGAFWFPVQGPEEPPAYVPGSMAPLLLPDKI